LIDISVLTGGTESAAKTSYIQEIEVYLYRGIVDMRKSINGLLTIVEQELGLSPFAPGLFVFCNRQRDKIKILYWEHSGFVLWYKRPEKARFPWPRRDKDGVGRSSSCRGS
jgi:transposase